MVLILGAILIATGIIDTGDESSEPIISQSPIVQPAVDEDGDGSTVNEIYRRSERGSSSSRPGGGPTRRRSGFPTEAVTRLRAAAS